MNDVFRIQGRLLRDFKGSSTSSDLDVPTSDRSLHRALEALKLSLLPVKQAAILMDTIMTYRIRVASTDLGSLHRYSRSGAYSSLALEAPNADLAAAQVHLRMSQALHAPKAFARLRQNEHMSIRTRSREYIRFALCCTTPLVHLNFCRFWNIVWLVIVSSLRVRQCTS